jgi:hypothetical protein
MPVDGRSSGNLEIYPSFVINEDEGHCVDQGHHDLLFSALKEVEKKLFAGNYSDPESSLVGYPIK